jgi:hypothetical protein
MPILIILTILLTPTFTLTFHSGPFPTNILMVWVGIVWIIFVVQLFLKKQFAAFLNFLKKLDKKIIIATGLFFLAGLLSLFVKGFDSKKLGQFIVLFLEPISLFFIAGFVFRESPKAKTWLLYAFYIFLGAAGIYALLQYFTLIGLPNIYWGNSVEPKRATSFFGHPDFYALFSAPLLVFLLPDLFDGLFTGKFGRVSSTPSLPSRPSAADLFDKTQGRPEQSRTGERRDTSIQAYPELVEELGIVQKKNKFLQLCKLILWIFGAIGLLLSLSRAGWLGLAAGVAIYTVVAGNKNIKRLIATGAVISILIVAWIPNLRYRIIGPFYGEKSANSRVSLWQTGWKGIEQSPIFGLGLNGFSNNWSTLNTNPTLDSHNFPHNIFLDMWVDLGLLGLFSFVFLCGIYIYRELRAFRSNFPLNNFTTLNSLAISLFLLTLLIQGQFDNPYFRNDLAILFWILLSIGI